MIRLAAAARADLRYIDAWLRPRAGNLVTDRVIETILEAIERLGRFPARGRPGRRSGTRELMITRYPYLVVYQENGTDVVIARVLHTRQLRPAPTT